MLFKGPDFRFEAVALVFVFLAGSKATAAGPLNVPNSSFESPSTTFVNVNIDSWQKAPKPEWYDEGGPFLWEQLAGIFKNTDPGRPDHIDNCDGAQAMWMFVVPDVAVFQDYNTVDWNDTNGPTHDFHALFEVGKAYDLTVGLIGGGGGMLPGATMELSLYYRDDASNFVTVASTSVTNMSATFSNTTHLNDFKVRVPPVEPSDAWAGKNIGIRLLSTVTTNLQGGYWDVDNIRLVIRNPVLLLPMWTNGEFQFTLKSEPGLRFEILGSSDPSLPRADWASLGIVTNVTGTVSYADVTAPSTQRFYQARELP